MAIRKRLNFNIDKLRLCYQQTSELFDSLCEVPINAYVNYEDFSLHIIDNDGGEVEERPTQIITNVLIGEQGSMTCIGQFAFNNTRKYAGLCFFTFENKSLYDVSLYYLEYIATILGLRLNSVTEVEIAADCNTNAVAKIRKLIANHREYDMFVNGKRITDSKRIIRDYLEQFPRSRERLARPTLYVHQEDRDLELRVYNKSAEIQEESRKTYIEEYNAFGSQDIYRMEVTLRWREFKKWMAYLNTPACGLMADWKQCKGEDDKTFAERSLLLLLGLEEYRAAVWHYLTERLLRFRHQPSQQNVCLLDVACGELPS